MEETVQNIHIVPTRTHINHHVFLLFIPALIFVFVLALIVRAKTPQYAASTSDTSVLGSETQK